VLIVTDTLLKAMSITKNVKYIPWNGMQELWRLSICCALDANGKRIGIRSSTRNSRRNVPILKSSLKRNGVTYLGNALRSLIMITADYAEKDFKGV